MLTLPEIAKLIKAKGAVIVGVTSLGFFLLGLGVIASLSLSKNDWKEIEIVNNQTAAESGAANVTEMTVDVGGAVEKPGVYALSPGARITDALVAAGGLSATADRNWVAREINLAQNITDGMKIYINSLEITTAYNASKTPSGESSVLSVSSQISVNTASTSELDSLWGVGEARAEAIVAGRPYGSIDELVSRKILPGSVVEKNRLKLKL